MTPTELRDQLVNRTVAIEGGYTNDPKDSGGETIFGITIAVARAYGYTGEMVTMPRAIALAIYRARFWDSMLLDQVAAMSPEIAGELFDSGVNCSVETASRWLQRCLNVLNKNGTLYPDTKPDGRVGLMTLAAIREYLKARGEEGERTLLKALNCLQGAFYIGLAEAREKDEAFVYGWIRARVEI